MATTQKLTAQLSEILNLPQEVIADALAEVTRIELLRVARNERELIQTPVLPFPQVQADDDDDLSSLYEANIAC
jgi:hypothetical protein